MINFTHRMEDLLIQGEFVDRYEDKPPHWNLAIADFHKKESCEVEATDEEVVALLVLAMGVGENSYDGYWPKLLYSRIENLLNKIPLSIRPVP